MSCSHVDSCPLFPMLNNSLAGWRESYCDTDNRFLDCARFKASRSGKPVPLALLPNGKIIGGIANDLSTKKVTVGSAQELQAGSVAVLSDEAAETVLEEARTAKGFWGRFKGLFGVKP
ncbi:MAG: hypothetical protein HKN03_07880 [Acidimicrobiales bacterium]|nr:hypothetical protein [Acidimicrobiales bacterium]